MKPTKEQLAEEYMLRGGEVTTLNLLSKCHFINGHESRDKEVEILKKALEESKIYGFKRAIKILKSEDCAQTCSNGVDKGRFGILWKSPFEVAQWLEQQIESLMKENE